MNKNTYTGSKLQNHFTAYLLEFIKGRRYVVEDLMATCNQLAVMKKGRFLYTGTMRELLNKARGHVWECCTEDESLARELERKYHISSKQYTEEGIRLRLLGENMPSESGCIACDVTLEDAYIYVTNR